MQLTPGRPARALFALVVALVAVTWIAAPAQSHSQLVSSSPGEGESVEEPATVSLVFNEELIQVGSEVSVTDASGATTALIPTYPQPTTLAADLPALTPGPASVAWRVVSADGHPIEGVLNFTVTSAPEPEPSPSTSPSTTAETAAASTPTPSPSASVVPIGAPGPAGGLPAWLWVALVAAVLAAGAVAVITSRRR